MWPQVPTHVTAPQAPVEELGLEGAPKPGCRAGLQLRAAPHGQLSSAFSQWPSLLASGHQGAGKERSTSAQTAWGRCRRSSRTMARGTLEEDEEIKEREDKEPCGGCVITCMTQLLYPHTSVCAPRARAHLGQGLGGCKEDLLTEISALLVTHVQLSMHHGSNIYKNASCFW